MVYLNPIEINRNEGHIFTELFCMLSVAIIVYPEKTCLLILHHGNLEKMAI